MKKTLKLFLLCICMLSALTICFSCNIYSKPTPHRHVYERRIYDAYLVSPATCSSKAVYYYSCKICSEKSNETFEYGDYAHDIIGYSGYAPTCTEKGFTDSATCRLCGEIITPKEEIPALGHEYINGVCTRCGEKEPPHTHTLVVIEERNATCIEEGYRKSICSVCKEEITEQISALGHNLQSFEGKIATCTEEGYTPYEECTRCGYSSFTKIKALGHNIIKHEGKPSTCTKKGYAAYETCTRCDYTTYRELPLAEHNFVNGICSNCGKKLDEHTHIEVIDEGVEPTCTKSGLTSGKHCSICNEILVEQKTIPAKGHTEVIDKGVAPTETTSGLTEGKHCSACGEILVAQREIPASGTIGLAYAANEDGTTCTVIGLGTCTKNDIIIPIQNESGLVVTAIGDNAFSECSNTTSIIIPDTITTIGTRAFYGCTGLTSIHIPSSVTSIGISAAISGITT